MATSPKTSDQSIHDNADATGRYDRKDSVFRSWISSEPGSHFPPEKDRYVLYINLGCPWAHRTNIVRSLKGLEDIIQLVVGDCDLFKDGWAFTGRDGTADKDPIYGFAKFLKILYLKASPSYSGRFTVPILWDTHHATIVNNESAEIIRMFYTCFDSLLPAENREINKPDGGLLPSHKLKEIDELNDWVYHTVNNGVYKCGFAISQEAYDENVFPLFASLDRLEGLLASQTPSPYLFGEHITDADIRLYVTIARFDVAYHTLFKCNLKMIRHDYPYLQSWYQRLFYHESGAFGEKTVDFKAYREGYARASKQKVVPRGPVPDMLPKEHVPLQLR